MKYGSVITLFLISMLPVCVQAQAGGAQNSLLPEINPQDIEIRSEFRARFPGLRRQPILGFNPSPRVFRIDPNRVPFMESRDEAVASIAVSQLNRPVPPKRSYLPVADRTDLYSRIGFGSFITPEVEIYGNTLINDDSRVSASLNYRSTDGHLSYQESSFRYFDVDATYSRNLSDDLLLQVGIGALSDQNDLYNLDPFFQGSMGNTSNKSYSGLNLNTSLQKMKNAVEGWELDLAANTYDTELNAFSSGLGGNVTENVVRGRFEKHWAGKNIEEVFTFDVFGTGGSYDISSAGSEGWVHTGGGIRYQRRLSSQTHVEGRAGLEYVSDAFSDKVYLVPELTLKRELFESLTLDIQAYARPDMPEVMELQQFNRFMNTNTQLQHAYNAGLKAEGHIQLFKGNRVFAGGGYEFTRDYAYFRRNTETVGTTSVPTFYNVVYDNVNTLTFYGGIAQQVIPNKFWFSSRVYVRRPELSSGGRVPFEERLGLEGSLSYKLIRDFTLNASAEYIGNRRTAVTDSKLDGYLLVNGGAEYQINDRFGVYLRLVNMLGQDYQVWEGYQERPFQAFGGLTIKL